MKKVVCILAVLFIANSAFAQSTEEKIWQRVEALSGAIFKTRHRQTLEELISNNVSYGHSNGTIEDKKTMIDKAVANKTEYKKALLERVQIQVAKKTAIVRYNFSATALENGTESPLRLAILQVWKKEKGQWQLWARQAVRLNS